MRFAVIQFPGSNCDQDCLRALRDDLGIAAEYVWHKTTSLAGYDAVVLPGGFSYGDYLRCGAMAKFSPIMKSVRDFAEAGGLVIGVCNGFQMLCEMRLLPGALLRNRDLHFICAQTALRVETSDSPFTSRCRTGELLRIPIAHGEGSYFADDATLRDLEVHRQILLRYVDAETGVPTPESNPNGSLQNIAGICNRERNVFGLMPHPDRASHARLGSDDGRKIFESMADALRARGSRATTKPLPVTHPAESPTAEALAVAGTGNDVAGV